jgi:DNA-directed RNA polymerase subunit alpha
MLTRQTDEWSPMGFVYRVLADFDARLRELEQEPVVEKAPVEAVAHEKSEDATETQTETADLSDMMKTRIDTLPLSSRILNALAQANIRTLGGIARKKEDDLLEIEGIGEKGLQEIKRILSDYGITLK